MYHNKMAAAIKVNGRVVRDNDETAYIPFGAEYSIFIKNLNSVRALISISVDGTDATGGTRLIVEPNSSVELERFIENGNLNAGLRFKFIERSEKIENGPRGVKVDDGLIRISYEFERVQPPILVSYTPYRYNLSRTFDTNVYGSNATSTATYSADDVTRGASLCSTASITSANTSTSPLRSAEASTVGSNAVPQNTAGITVGGSVSDQKFSVGSWFPTDGVEHVMVLRLLGEVEGRVVTQPVLARTKVDCPTCGTKNKVGTKFCSECGTGLSIV